MKTKLTLASICLLFTGMMTVSCGESAKAKAQQEELDSIHRADSLAKAAYIADSLKKEEAKNFTTPDQAIWNLKGHVKSVKVSATYDKEYPESYLSADLNFDQKGELTKISVSEFDHTTNIILGGKGTYHHKVSRDNQGRIHKLVPNPITCAEFPEQGTYTFTYNKKGHIAKIEGIFECGTPNMEVVYKEGELPTKSSMSGMGDFSYSYKYEKFDDYGNWITRTVKLDSYAEMDGDTDIHKTYTEQRQIEYYEAEDVNVK